MAKNPEYLLRLFDMDQQGKSLVEEHSPVSQNLILVSGVKRNPRNASFQLLTSGGPLDLGTRRLNFNFNEGVMARRARFAKAVTPEEDCTIVYANDPSDAEQLARLLAQGEPEPEELEEDIVELIEFLREEVHPQYELIETLKHRVAFHYGFMPGIVRARVEDLFKGSKLRFICCTSTLLQGVNLPARNIIIENPRRGRGNPMDRAAFLNLAGRAGRLLKEFHGNVWCLKPEKWDNACYEGARLQEMSSAFALTLEDGGSLIRQAVDGTVTQDQMDLATTALGKVFTEFTQEGKRLENSKYRSGDNAEDLRETSDLCARIRTDLPREVFRRNFTILPMRLQELYQHLKRRPDIASCIPPLPHRPGFYERMTFIFQILDLTLSKIENQSHKFHAWLAYNWIHDMPLREMIEVRIQFLRIKGRFISVGVTIAELMKALENDIRHRYVKHLRAYNDVLAFVLREAGRDDLAADLKPLHLFIECGASDPVVLSLITIGLSRTTALLLKGKVRFTEGESPEDCLARLSATNLSSLNIPALCRKEIEEILRS